MNEPKILDACCGGKMFWFDKNHKDAVYVDNRTFEGELMIDPKPSPCIWCGATEGSYVKTRDGGTLCESCQEWLSGINFFETMLMMQNNGEGS